MQLGRLTVQAKKHLIWILLPVLIAILSVIYGFPVFHRSDDVGILSVLAGAYGASDWHVLFTHAYLGVFLNVLYSTWPTFSWYEIILTIISSASLGYLCYHYSVYLRTRFVWVILFISLANVGLFVFTNIHFTFAAAIPAIACYSSFFLRNTSDEGHKIATSLFLSLFLGFLSICIRPEVFYLITMLFVPVFALRTLQDWSVKERRLIWLWFGLGIFGLTSSMYYANYRMNRGTVEWTTYMDYFNARANFTDYVAPFSATGLEKAAWSKNDYDLLINWFYADNTVYTTERMNGYVSAIPSAIERRLHRNSLPKNNIEKPVAEKQAPSKPVSEQSQASATKAETHETPRQQSVLDRYLLVSFWSSLPFVLMILLSFVMLPMSWKLLGNLGTTYLCAVLLLAYMFLFLKPPPPRVIYVFLITIFSIHVLHLSAPLAPIVGFKRGIIFLCSVLFVCYSFSWQHRLYKIREAATLKMKEAKSTYGVFASKFKDKTAVVWSNSFSSASFTAPFDQDAIQLVRENKLLHLGSYYGSPFYQRYLATIGLSNISEDICNSEKVVLLSSPDLLPLFQTFMFEHYNKRISFSLCDKTIGAYAVTTE